MERPRILVVYGTRHGQCAKIAKHVAEHLSDRGCLVDVRWGKNLTMECPITHYDGVVVGASIYNGRHQDYIAEFVRAHRPFLKEMPTGFFSVSGAAGDRDGEGMRKAEGLLGEFERRTGWRAGIARCFAGSIPYTQYGPVVRQIMKWIVGRNRGDTDTTRDFEYTDWDRVDAFAESYFESLDVEIAPAPSPEEREEIYRSGRRRAG